MLELTRFRNRPDVERLISIDVADRESHEALWPRDGVGK
jgi:hypothetical protein